MGVVYVWIWKERCVCKWVWQTRIFFLSSYLNMQSLSQNFHFEQWKDVLCKHGYSNTCKQKRLNARHNSPACLCFNTLESTDLTYSAWIQVTWQNQMWKIRREIKKKLSYVGKWQLRKYMECFNDTLSCLSAWGLKIVTILLLAQFLGFNRSPLPPPKKDDRK